MTAETILSTLQHALGVDAHGQGEQYRNHFVCGEGHHSYAACCAAVEQGLMRRREVAAYSSNGSCFHVTDVGRAWMTANSPPPPKLTRGQARYLAWLRIADVTGESFIAFLRRQGQPA